MAKHTFVKIGVAASLCVAALPLLSVSAAETAVTQVELTVTDSVNCSSAGNTNTTDINMGELAPGEQTASPFVLSIHGSTNNLGGFKITGQPTDLEHEDYVDVPSGPKVVYKFGDTVPTTAYWWITTSESSGVVITDEVTLTSTALDRTFSLGTNAKIATTTPSGTYYGKISWTCTAGTN